MAIHQKSLLNKTPFTVSSGNTSQPIPVHSSGISDQISFLGTLPAAQRIVIERPFVLALKPADVDGQYLFSTRSQKPAFCPSFVAGT